MYSIYQIHIQCVPRLRWFGHVEFFFGAVRTAWDLQIDGGGGTGRLKLTCKKLTEKTACKWKLTTAQSTWRSGVRFTVCTASQLPAMRPTDVDDAPAPACL